MTSTHQTEALSEEKKFLEWLNCNLPQGVDWKQGALDYIAARLSEDNGEISRRFHLTKPFYSVESGKPINKQLEEFTREVTHFLNVLSMLSISPDARFLDVACGSGWWTHFLSKLNLQVVGIDISSDMIELTKERLRLDGIPTPESDTFDRVTLLTHDMEESALPHSLQCDVAILESALHHFVDPIQTLRNISDSLSDDGILVILEGTSDGQGDPYCVEIMQRYNTLERPYTREQLVAILQFAGMAEYEFFHPVNGFFLQAPDVADHIRNQILNARHWNTVFVAKRPGALKKYLEFEGSFFMQPTVLQPVKNLSANVENAAFPSVERSLSVVSSDKISLEESPSWGELGLKGELKILKLSSKRVVQKTIAKVVKILRGE
jgi:SAM-dependent methyltransferase